MADGGWPSGQLPTAQRSLCGCHPERERGTWGSGGAPTNVPRSPTRPGPSLSLGMTISIIPPPRSPFIAAMVPWCSAMIFCVIASPSPLPPGRRLKNGSNTCARSAGGKPGPRSATVRSSALWAAALMAVAAARMADGGWRMAIRAAARRAAQFTRLSSRARARDLGLGWRAHERASQPHPPRSFALARDDNLDHSAAALPVHRRDGAVVLGHDLLCDRESESAAAGAAAEERLEYVREVGGGEAGTVIGDGEEQRAVAVAASADGDVGAGRGEVDRVLDDVLEHLQHAVGVDRCLGESAVDVLFDLDPLLFRARRADAQRLGEHRTQRLRAAHGLVRTSVIE